METNQESSALQLKYFTKNLIERVAPNPNHAVKLIEQAENHLRSASNAMVDDQEGSYVLLYDAARKALTSILAIQGIRPTAFGGHSIILDVLIPQCNQLEIEIIKPFKRLRKTRNSVEYPKTDSDGMNEESLREDFLAAKKIVEWARAIGADENR